MSDGREKLPEPEDLDLEEVDVDDILDDLERHIDNVEWHESETYYA